MYEAIFRLIPEGGGRIRALLRRLKIGNSSDGSSENTMPSTATSTPARERRIPKARYQRTNIALRSGAKLASRCDPQILAARRGEAATNVPSAMADGTHQKVGCH